MNKNNSRLNIETYQRKKKGDQVLIWVLIIFIIIIIIDNIGKWLKDTKLQPISLIVTMIGVVINVILLLINLQGEKEVESYSPNLMIEESNKNSLIIKNYGPYPIFSPKILIIDFLGKKEKISFSKIPKNGEIMLRSKKDIDSWFSFLKNKNFIQKFIIYMANKGREYAQIEYQDMKSNNRWLSATIFIKKEILKKK